MVSSLVLYSQSVLFLTTVCNERLLDNTMSIQAQVLGIRIGMDIIVTNTDEFCINGGFECRIALQYAVRHGLLPYILDEPFYEALGKKD